MDSLKSGTSLPTYVSDKTAIKAISAPVVVGDDQKYENKLKPQTSAPSYFYSLSTNEAPPFKKPHEEKKPHILVGLLVTEEDVVRMIAVSDTDTKEVFKRYLGLVDNKILFYDQTLSYNLKVVEHNILYTAFPNPLQPLSPWEVPPPVTKVSIKQTDYLVDKNITLAHQLSEKTFLVSLMLQIMDYSAQRDFSAHKLACLLAVYIKTHLCFKSHFWTTPEVIWDYFKETLIRHTIEDSPDGCEVFAPDESYDILTHFHTLYFSNLALIHILCFGVYKLKFTWPFK